MKKPPKGSWAKYVDKGAYYIGVPARDLTPEEWASFDIRKRKRLLKFGIYVEMTEEEKNGISA